MPKQTFLLTIVCFLFLSFGQNNKFDDICKQIVDICASSCNTEGKINKVCEDLYDFLQKKRIFVLYAIPIKCACSIDEPKNQLKTFYDFYIYINSKKFNKLFGIITSIYRKIFNKIINLKFTKILFFNKSYFNFTLYPIDINFYDHLRYIKHEKFQFVDWLVDCIISIEAILKSLGYETI